MSLSSRTSYVSTLALALQCKDSLWQLLIVRISEKTLMFLRLSFFKLLFADEIKNFWRFSTAQTIAEVKLFASSLFIICACLPTPFSFSSLFKMEEKIETIKKSGRLGNFLLKFGLTDVKRYLDIHLIRISFLRIMNLPANFVYVLFFCLFYHHISFQ